MTLSIDDIRAAADRLKGHIERTPCRHSRTLSEITGAEVWVKFENLQFTAAYKERGALNTLLQLSDNERGRGVIAASAGNHSQGLAYHAARLGIPVTIVMPRSTPFVKVQQTRGHGANVVLEGDNYDEASAVAMRDGRIHAVGGDELLALRGDGVDVLTLAPGTTRTEFLDLAGLGDFMALDAADVVAHALSRLGRADVVVPGWFYRGGTFAMRFLPRGVNRAVFGRLLAAMRTEE